MVRLSRGEAVPVLALLAWALAWPSLAHPVLWSAWAYAAGALVAVAYALRRRAPIVCGTAMIGCLVAMPALEAQPSGLSEASAVIGAYVLEAHRRGTSWPVVALAAGAATLGLGALGAQLEFGLLPGVSGLAYSYYAALILAGAAAGAAMRDRRDDLRRLRHEVARLRRLATTALVAERRRERRRMALKVEDAVERTVDRIAPALKAARDGRTGAEVHDALDDVARRAAAALNELRGILAAPGTAPTALDSRTHDVLALAAPRSWWPSRALGERWSLVLVLLVAGIVERLTLPPLPLELRPGIVLEAPTGGEYGAMAVTVVSALLFRLRPRSAAAVAVLVGVLLLARQADGSLTGLQPTRDLLVAAVTFVSALHVLSPVRAAGLATIAIAGWAAGRPFDPVAVQWSEIYSLLALVLAGYVGGRSLRGPMLRAAATEAERAALVAEHAQLAEELRGLERDRVARELHDIVGHGLTVLRVGADGARIRAAGGQPIPGVLDQLDAALATTRAELDELRRLLHADADQPPAPASDWLEQLAGRAMAVGMRVDADVGAELDVAPSALRVTARRILEEAVTNALRHGDGRWLRIRSAPTSDGRALRLVVDSSVGTRVAGSEGSGTGIDGMRERAQHHGGSLAVERLGDRWRVEAVLPLAEAPADALTAAR